jgi:hypothetical protein
MLVFLRVVELNDRFPPAKMAAEICFKSGSTGGKKLKTTFSTTREQFPAVGFSFRVAGRANCQEALLSVPGLLATSLLGERGTNRAHYETEDVLPAPA